MKGYDVILGRSWLRSVNPHINWTTCTCKVGKSNLPCLDITNIITKQGRGVQATSYHHPVEAPLPSCRELVLGTW